jgi:hypothetical protein
MATVRGAGPSAASPTARAEQRASSSPQVSDPSSSIIAGLSGQRLAASATLAVAVGPYVRMIVPMRRYLSGRIGASIRERTSVPTMRPI